MQISPAATIPPYNQSGEVSVFPGKVHLCYPAGYGDIGSVHGNLSVLLAKFKRSLSESPERRGFEKKVSGERDLAAFALGKHLEETLTSLL